MIKILLASNNLHKLNEIESFFEGSVKILTLSSIGIYDLPEENARTFKENAILKVKEISDKIDLPILGDDSGLIVTPLSNFILKIKKENFDILKISESFSSFFDESYLQKISQFWKDYLLLLDKFPGIVSKRFGYIEDEKIRNEYLISLLKFINNRNRWNAYFETSLALKYKGKIYTFSGKAKGYIIDNPCGDNGFGYDPIFFYPPLNKTFAQLSLNEKNKVSHRSNALEKLKIFLSKNLLI